MNLKYPLIVRKKEKSHDGLKLVLARRGYFRLDKASFFIDDPFVLLKMLTRTTNDAIVTTDVAIHDGGYDGSLKGRTRSWR